MKDNYCILLAGGVGSRFWPYSTTKEPKQFIDFMGSGRSLLQMTYDRISKIIPKENIYIASNVSYKELVMKQLPSVSEKQILLEPAMRNTAPCIAYAVNKISTINPKANIIVSPSDQLVLREDDFVQSITNALEYTRTHDSLLTIGIKPNRPETNFGYIQVNDELDVPNFYQVKTFTEKPNVELAKLFVESGEFYWNSGIFLWNLNAIRKAFSELMPELFGKFDSGKAFYNTPEEDSFVESVYQSCVNISIDYAIFEKARNMTLMVADFGWVDIGTWSSLYDNSSKDQNGNMVLNGMSLSYESKDNIIALPEGKLAVVVGIEDLIIAEKDNVLLVCKRDEQSRIRQFVNDTKVQFGEKFL